MFAWSLENESKIFWKGLSVDVEQKRGAQCYYKTIPGCFF